MSENDIESEKTLSHQKDLANDLKTAGILVILTMTVFVVGVLLLT